MATQAQINANRQNAQKSTGPRTPEGKEAVSRNAIKHGLFTNDAIIAGESIEEYNLNREQLLNEFNPIGQMETILTERIVTLTWRLKRIERFQNIVIDSMLDNEVHNTSKLYTRRYSSDGSELHKEIQDNANYIIGNAIIDDYSESLVLDRLSIYERRIEGSLYRTMSELKRLQVARKKMELDSRPQTSDTRQERNEAREMSDEGRVKSAKQSQFSQKKTESTDYDRKSYENFEQNENISLSHLNTAGHKANPSTSLRTDTPTFGRKY